MFPKFKLKKKQPKPLDEKNITAILEQQLRLQEQKHEEFLHNLEHDKERQRLWNSLSTRAKIRLLKYASERGNNEKQVSGIGAWFKKQKKKV